MDTAVGALRTAALVFVAVAVLFGIYLRQLAETTATTAAAAAAGAAAASLDSTGWDCTATSAHWPTADRVAARAAAARTASGSAAAAADYTLAADPSCTVVASVTVAAAGARSWLTATAVACRPTRAAPASGWSLPEPC